jgi:hypothetical protein
MNPPLLSQETPLSRKGYLKNIKTVANDMQIRKFRLPKDVDKIVEDIIKEVNGE